MWLRPRGLSIQLGPKETAQHAQVRTARGIDRASACFDFRRRHRHVLAVTGRSRPAPSARAGRSRGAREGGARFAAAFRARPKRGKRPPRRRRYRRRVLRRRTPIAAALVLAGAFAVSAGAGNRDWAEPQTRALTQARVPGTSRGHFAPDTPLAQHPPETRPPA